VVLGRKGVNPKFPGKKIDWTKFSKHWIENKMEDLQLKLGSNGHNQLKVSDYVPIQMKNKAHKGGFTDRECKFIEKNSDITQTVHGMSCESRNGTDGF
jgi:hypothetical protein